MQCDNWALQVECSVDACSHVANPGHCNNTAIQLFRQQEKYSHVRVGKNAKFGYGLFAATRLEPGTLVGEYVGKVRTSGKKMKKGGHSYRMGLVADLFIDASKQGNVLRYINSSCKPNCGAFKWTVEQKPCIGVFVEQEPIEEGTELTMYYGKDWGNGSWCLCGTSSCKAPASEETSR